MEKEVLLLQEGDDPVPLDYRDLVSIYRHPDKINDYIAEFAPQLLERLQEVNESRLIAPLNLLERLEIGAPAAENEASNLQYYFLPTHQYHEARSGKIRLAVGRKGSGKGVQQIVCKLSRA